MGKTNSKFVVPSIAAAVVLCLACVCCAGIGLYFYGDQLLSGFSSPTIALQSSEARAAASTPARSWVSRPSQRARPGTPRWRRVLPLIIRELPHAASVWAHYEQVTVGLRSPFIK